MEYFILFDFGYHHQKNFISQITYDADSLGYPIHNQWWNFHDSSVYGIWIQIIQHSFPKFDISDGGNVYDR